MKALSIVAPSGRNIAEGRKTLEIRRWRPDLAPDEDLLIVENHRFLHRDGEEDPDGRAVAVVRVGRIRPFEAADIPAACASYHEPGWLAWELIHIRPLRPCARRIRAARGLYDVAFEI